MVSPFVLRRSKMTLKDSGRIKANKYEVIVWVKISAHQVWNIYNITYLCGVCGWVCMCIACQQIHPNLWTCFTWFCFFVQANLYEALMVDPNPRSRKHGGAFEISKVSLRNPSFLPAVEDASFPLAPLACFSFSVYRWQKAFVWIPASLE